MKKKHALTEEEKTTLIRSNKGLIPFVARRYFHRFPFIGFTKDEMFRIGDAGLVEALKHWKPQLGAFPQYACHWIRQALHVALRQRTAFIHIPQETAKQPKALKQFADVSNTNPLDIHPGDPLIQDMTGLSARQIKRAQGIIIIGHTVASLESSAPDANSDRPIGDALPNTQTLWHDYNADDDPERICIEKQIHQELWSVFASVLNNGQAQLTPQQKKILRLVFLEGNSMAEVGRLLDCTRANIESHVKKSLLKIRPFFYDFH